MASLRSNSWWFLAACAVLLLAVSSCLLPVGRCHNEELDGTALFRARQDGRFCFVFDADGVEFCLSRTELPAGLQPETGGRYPAQRYTSLPPCTPGRYYSLRSSTAARP